MTLNVSQSDLQLYLFKFFGSLNQYPQRYLPLVFETLVETPKHLAYLCPLCVQNFIYHTDDLKIYYLESFSLDHYPPQNVGGSKKMLTCTKCNNTAGYSYENSLKERIEKETFNRKIPNIEVQAITNMEDVQGWLPSKLSMEENGKFNFQLTKLKKGRISEIDGQAKERKMHIRVKSPDDKKVTKALLKTAYLYCFD